MDILYSKPNLTLQAFRIRLEKNERRISYYNFVLKINKNKIYYNVRL